MLRLLGVGLVAALVLAAGAAGREPLTEQEYLSALEHAIDGVPDRDWLSADPRLGDEVEQFVRRLERLQPPANVVEIHAAWIASLRDCVLRYRKLEGSSPLDGVIVAREMKPCFDRHREICDRFYEKGYSFG